ADRQASISEITAQIARQQVETASQELRLKQAPNVDITAETLGFVEGRFQAKFVILNKGAYTIDNVQVEGVSQVAPRVALRNVWALPIRGTTYRLVPDVPHEIFMRTEGSVDDSTLSRIRDGSFVAIHAIRVMYKDAAGKPHS
ncbi:hypothetical protein LVR64_29215, partial [Pseudomonas aeruginosa]|uniref:hypothetical protein n=1 Tax=Pseudomonas aeruginosa TaxID=287 RepID=UPI00209417EA